MIYIFCLSKNMFKKQKSKYIFNILHIHHDRRERSINNTSLQIQYPQRRGCSIQGGGGGIDPTKGPQVNIDLQHCPLPLPKRLRVQKGNERTAPAASSEPGVASTRSLQSVPRSASTMQTASPHCPLRHVRACATPPMPIAGRCLPDASHHESHGVVL